MTSFVKPNIDKTLYLYSSKAKKTLNDTSVMENRWDIPDITLNDWGKVSLVSHQYKSIAPTATPITTRIKNVGTKNTIDTFSGNGAILDVSCFPANAVSKPVISLVGCV